MTILKKLLAVSADILHTPDFRIQIDPSAMADDHKAYLKYVGLSLVAFSIPATIQLGFIVDEFHPHQLAVPLIVSVLVGLLLGRNSILRQRLKTSNDAKSGFLSRMSHELRTPMNAILGFAQILESDKASPLTDDQRHSVREIITAGYHLQEMIDDLLDLSMLDQSRIQVSLSDTNIHEIITAGLGIISPLANECGIAVNYHRDKACHHHVRADALRLKQVMVNLLSNAIKYNRENGSVSVDCCKIRPDTLRISVTDTGPGIRASDQSLLFKPFHRLTEHHMHVKGAGIGLTISRRLIHLMHGNMGCDSTPGTGSTFWLELPLASR